MRGRLEVGLLLPINRVDQCTASGFNHPCLGLYIRYYVRPAGPTTSSPGPGPKLPRQITRRRFRASQTTLNVCDDYKGSTDNGDVATDGQIDWTEADSGAEEKDKDGLSNLQVCRSPPDHARILCVCTCIGLFKGDIEASQVHFSIFQKLLIHRDGTSSKA